MPLCPIKGCNSTPRMISERTGRLISFHIFPRDIAKRDKWLKSMRCGAWLPTMFTKICSEHFTLDCFMTNTAIVRLKPGAVPTLIPEPNRQTPAEEPSTSAEEVPKSPVASPSRGILLDLQIPEFAEHLGAVTDTEIQLGKSISLAEEPSTSEQAVPKSPVASPSRGILLDLQMPEFAEHLIAVMDTEMQPWKSISPKPEREESLVEEETSESISNSDSEESYGGIQSEDTSSTSNTEPLSIDDETSSVILSTPNSPDDSPTTVGIVSDSPVQSPSFQVDDLPTPQQAKRNRGDQFAETSSQTPAKKLRPAEEERWPVFWIIPDSPPLTEFRLDDSASPQQPREEASTSIQSAESISLSRGEEEWVEEDPLTDICIEVNAPTSADFLLDNLPEPEITEQSAAESVSPSPAEYEELLGNLGALYEHSMRPPSPNFLLDDLPIPDIPEEDISEIPDEELTLLDDEILENFWMYSESPIPSPSLIILGDLLPDPEIGAVTHNSQSAESIGPSPAEGPLSLEEPDPIEEALAIMFKEDGSADLNDN